MILSLRDAIGLFFDYGSTDLAVCTVSFIRKDLRIIRGKKAGGGKNVAERFTCQAGNDKVSPFGAVRGSPRNAECYLQGENEN